MDETPKSQGLSETSLSLTPIQSADKALPFSHQASEQLPSELVSPPQPQREQSRSKADQPPHGDSITNSALQSPLKLVRSDYMTQRSEPAKEKPKKEEGAKKVPETAEEFPVLDPNGFHIEKEHFLSSDRWTTQMWFEIVRLKSIGVFTEGIVKALHKVLQRTPDINDEHWHRFALWIHNMAVHGDQLERGLMRMTSSGEVQVLSMEEIRLEVNQAIISYFRGMGINIWQNGDETLLPDYRTIDSTLSTLENSLRGELSHTIVECEEMADGKTIRNKTTKFVNTTDFKSIPVLHKYHIDSNETATSHSARDIGFGTIWTTFDGRIAFTDDEQRDYFLYYHCPPNESHWDGFVHYLPIDVTVPRYFYPIHLRNCYIPGAVPDSFTEVPYNPPSAPSTSPSSLRPLDRIKSPQFPTSGAPLSSNPTNLGSRQFEYRRTPDQSRSPQTKQRQPTQQTVRWT